MPDDPSDLQPPDLETTESATEIYERLEAYESSGGDVDALLSSEDAEVVSAPERPARTEETEAEQHESPDEPVATEEEAEPAAPVAPAEPEKPAEEPDDLAPDLDAPRAPKPDFDPEKLTTEEGRKAYEYAERLRRYQQSHYAKKINAIVGTKKPEQAREILARWDTLNTAPELESARTLIRGDSEYASFADALLNRNHPAHEAAVQRYRRGTSEPADPRQDEQIVQAIVDPDTGDVDPRRVANLLTQVRERTLQEARQQQPAAPSAASFEAWAATNQIPEDDRLEMARMWEEDNRPAFPDVSRVRYFEGLKKRLADSRAAEWEKTRVQELQRHVQEATPKPRSVGAGVKGQKIDWDAFDDPVEIAAAIESGKIDIDDPAVKRLAGLD